MRLKHFLRLNYGDPLPAEAREEGPFTIFGSNGSVGSHRGVHHRTINNALRRLGVEPVADPEVLKVTLFRRADIPLEFYDGKL